MPFQLSSDQVAQLTLLLGSLARLIAQGTLLSPERLEVLVLAAGLESMPAVLDELHRWAQLLQQVHDDPGVDIRHIIIEGLLLRGLPEASVLLAVDAVTRPASGLPTSGPSLPGQELLTSRQALVSAPLSSVGPISGRPWPPPAARRDLSLDPLTPGIVAGSIHVQPAQLEWVLTPGQGGVADLEVCGGPGHVVVESDQVQVHPTQFGSDPTRIHVEVRPLFEGMVWTTLKLLTTSETRDIPILGRVCKLDAYLVQLQDETPP